MLFSKVAYAPLRLLRPSTALILLFPLGIGGASCSSDPAPGTLPVTAATAITPTAEVPLPLPDPKNPANPLDADDVPAKQTRYYRLTHREWENSVRDLFPLDPALVLSRDFRPDSVVGIYFENDSLRLEVDEPLWRSYQSAAAKVAEYLTLDATRLNAILPPADISNLAFWDANQVKAEEFVKVVGGRAFRRPLTDAEVARYRDVYNIAGGMYEGIGEFESGIRLVIEALLLSPEFTYRIERSTTPQGPVIPLDAFEVAARLSYTLWDSLPDSALFQAAKAGGLIAKSDVKAQATRLISDPRSQTVLVEAHAQLFDAARYASINPSLTAFPNVSPTLIADATEENRRFVGHALFTTKGGLGALLTSTETFVNAPLAALYGLQGSFGAEFVPVMLPAAERRGFLTRIGFLASHATSAAPDPIHRGLFVSDRLLCQEIKAPPVEIPPLPPPDNRTNRQRVEAHTEQPGSGCTVCHATLINPLGFPFENYDAIGSFRTRDGNQAVDAKTTIQLDGSPMAVNNALELSEALAASAQVHACYVKHLVEFAFSRASDADDANIIQRLGTASVGSNMSTQDLLVSIVTSEAFLNRSAKELP